jgi:heat shock protein HslJ
MFGKRQTTVLITVGVVGAVIIVVLRYMLYNVWTLPQRTPAATETVRPLSLTSTSTPVPESPTSTPVPAATATPTNTCVDGMTLVQHLSFDNQDVAQPPALLPGRPFTKSWRIQNTGTCLWDPGYSVVYVDGNHTAADMSGTDIVIHGQTAPLETYDIEVKLLAPREPGTYQGFWQMHNAASVYFGDRLPVAIAVSPVLTPAPTNTPRLATAIQFNLDRSRMIGGECAVFSWTITDAQAAYFYSEGQRWQAHGVPFNALRDACPDQTTSYYLRVVRANGWVETKRRDLHIEQPPDAPQITHFTPEPAQVPVGECVNLSWKVEGQVTLVRLLRDSGVLWDDAPLDDSLRDCPPGSGEVGYTIEATGPGGTTRDQRTVSVGSTPQTLSGTEWQVLAIGSTIPASAAQPPTVLFGLQDTGGQGTVAGWGGCNTYSATYRQTGKLLTIGAPSAGSNTCPTNVLLQEQTLLDALQAAATLSRNDGQLILWNNGGEVALNLAASEAAGP